MRIERSAFVLPSAATSSFLGTRHVARVGLTPVRVQTLVQVRPAPVRMLFGFGKKSPSKKSSTPRGTNPYRALGVAETATYDDVEAAVKRLTVKYADDRKKLMMLDVYKDQIFEDRLQQRMSGALQAKIKESPYDLKPKPKKRFEVPPWAAGVVALPKFAYFRRTGIIFGIFVVLGFVTPTLAGSCMAMAFIAAAGFLYNRGLPEPVRDDYGGIGEVRPVKHRIVLKTLIINLAVAGTFFGLSQLYLLYLPIPVSVPVDSFVNAAVVFGLWASCLFFQAHGPDDLL